ncbi:hypothetical protein [Algisphaera agarilytica]|uniref:Uncharacterized protein n=1 Tax=Algisphaera agarilytica TaxID=1385975 RepID=A0A7X0H7X2_9BACT|nr:hypothetical protein [Algisphaera agarilytica]MBB6430702.1 hypothetical protein [Algisphaera agarilytica]
MLDQPVLVKLVEEGGASVPVGVSPWDLVGVAGVVLIGLLVPYYAYSRLRPEKARLFSSLTVLVILLGILLYTIARGYLQRVLNMPIDSNFLLSPEVMAALVGSFFTVVLGAFVVNHLMESAEERSAVRSAVQAHYGEKVKLLEDFSNVGQKILFYALAYRQAEEWLIRHGSEEPSEYAESKSARSARFGIGNYDGPKTHEYYLQMQRHFVDAGSMHGMARAVESTFFNSYDLSAALVRQSPIQAGALPNDGENHLIVTRQLIERFDEFLNTRNYREWQDYKSASARLREDFRVLNDAYSNLIESMYLTLSVDRQDLVRPGSAVAIKFDSAQIKEAAL